MNSHIFSIEDEETKRSLKNIIKKFENNLINKPTTGLLNIGIIDFDYLYIEPQMNSKGSLSYLKSLLNQLKFILSSKESKNIPKTIKSRLITIGHLKALKR